MNYGFINHNSNKQTKSPMLRYHKPKQKKISDSNRTNAAVFNCVTGKNFLNTFRKSTSKDKSNLKYKTSKNSPNSSLKKIDVAEEFKKLSNEHKDTQPGGGGPEGLGKKKKNSNLNKNDLYEDFFMKKIKKIYSKNVENNNGNHKFKKMSTKLFNMHSNNNKDNNHHNYNNNLNFKRDNKKYLYSNNISNMDYSGKISHHIDSSSEENNMLFNNKNHSSITSSTNPYGILVNSSSILASGNNTNLNLNEIATNQNNNINNNNNLVNNNISSPSNINPNENGFVSNYNLMKHIENKYEKIGNINNNNIIENSNKQQQQYLIDKNNSNLNIKSSNIKLNMKVKISSVNCFNNSNNNHSINSKFIYPKFLVKYGEENSSNINNVSNKKSNSILAPGVGIGAYSEFTKLNKTSYPSKNNSSKNSLEKRRSKLLNNNNCNNNIFINNNSLLQNQEENTNTNNIVINTKRVKSNDNNINIINNISNNISNNNNLVQDSNIFNKSKSNKETTNSYVQNNNSNNNSNNNTFYSNNLIKSSQLSSGINNNINNNNINNNNINNFSLSNLKGMNPRIERKGENVNVIINNSNKNISIINVNNISYNKQKKIEINNINNNGTCNTNRAKNNNYLLNKIKEIQPPPYVEYISTANKNINITNTNQDKKHNKKNSMGNDKYPGNINNGIKILQYNKKTPATKTKSTYNRQEIHNRSNSGLLTSNQLEMLVSDIISKKKITLKPKDFNTSLNSKNSKSKSKSKKNIEDSFHGGNNTSRPETNKARLIKNSVPISHCQSPGGKINEHSINNILINSNNKIINMKENINNNNKDINKKEFNINININEISERQSLNNKNLNLNLNINNNGENAKLNLYNEINEKMASSKENSNNKLLNNSIENNHKNKSSNTSRCLNYKEKEFNKLSSNLNKQKSYINNNNLSLLEKKIIKNLKEGGIKLDLITNNTKALINKKDSSRDNNSNNNSTGLKKHLKSQRLIKDIHAFNTKLIKNHLFNVGKIDKSNNHSKRESKDKMKRREKDNNHKDNKNKDIKDDNIINKEHKLTITPPKMDNYSKKLINHNSNYINVLSSNKKREREREREKDKEKSKEKMNKNKIIPEQIKPEKVLNINNYNNYKEMLCEPTSSQKIKEENNHLTTTASHDCNYYKNEMEKLSSYIKNYYLENGIYPETNNQFYLFGRQIGHGAFGKVNISLHVASGRLVAIKTFTKKNLKNKHAKNKIKHEIEMLSRLRHPFITQILDSFETDKHIFIVMEYICGDLLGFIRKRGKLSESVTKVIFKQIIEGLKYIHRKKIVHRDIKLDNILIDLSNTVKICDFGVSKKINKGDIMYDHCGTPAYIAPEIFKNHGYEGYACDIWSAGVTLYYMLGGVQPFCAESIKDLEKIILEGKYEKLEDVSLEANNLIDGMLQLDPKKRLTEDEILNHPWIVNINLTHRSKLNLFTDAEKILLSKFNVDYLSSEKAELIENFTMKNLETNKETKDEGNTKSLIFAPYNSYIESNDEEEDNNDKNKKNNKSKKIKKVFEEDKIYEELKIRNDICKFGYRVQQANIQYELSNNKDFDNGVIKTQKEEEFKNQNEKIEKMDEEKILSARLSGLNSPKVRSANDSFEETEKIQIKKDVLKQIEQYIGYDKKYIINCLKKNKINYATATYFLLSRDDQNIFLNNNK